MTSEMPWHIAKLPRDKVGRPVPWFVAWIDDKPDFRIVGPGKIARARNYGLCWVCGDAFAGGTDRAWVIGPMCAVNRVTAEPSSHIDCARWSAENCPFLTTPRMVRRERHLPDFATDPPGVMISRNPGVVLIWVTHYRSWYWRKSDGLFHLGEAKYVNWFAEGREATRTEILAAIESGLPLLHEAAAKDGPDALIELDQQCRDALKYVPEQG